MSPPPVTFFVSCLGERHDARASECAARLVARTCPDGVHVPRGLTCCGRILHDAGLGADAARLLTRLARVLAGSGPIVTPAARCAAHVRAHAPSLSARVVDLAAFLAAHPSAIAGPAWDGPARLATDAAAAPALLARVDGLTLTPDAPTALVDDPATRHDLTRTDPDLEVKHLAEILAEALHLVPRPPRLHRRPRPTPGETGGRPTPAASSPARAPAPPPATVKDLSRWALLARGPLRWRLARGLLDRLYGPPDPRPFRARWRDARRRRGAPVTAPGSGSDP